MYQRLFCQLLFDDQNICFRDGTLKHRQRQATKGVPSGNASQSRHSWHSLSCQVNAANYSFVPWGNWNEAPRWGLFVNHAFPRLCRVAKWVTRFPDALLCMPRSSLGCPLWHQRGLTAKGGWTLCEYKDADLGECGSPPWPHLCSPLCTFAPPTAATSVEDETLFHSISRCGSGSRAGRGCFQL